MITVVQTALNGLIVLKPRIFEDARGYFFESFSKRDLEELVGPGLHFQKPPFSHAKLVRCTRGRVLDVAVDIRRGSPTFGEHFAVELSEENHLQFFIPKGFAHGFSVLSETAVFQYKCDEFYHPEADAGVLLTDPALGIDWKIAPEQMILSDKDKLRRPLRESDAI